MSRSDNKTTASYFMNKRLQDCHMDVYWYCQGGEQIIESIRSLQFADGKMFFTQLITEYAIHRANVL